jgi:Uma2 family endonuclease
MTTVTSQTTSELLRHVQDVHGTDETADLWPLVLKLPEAVVAGGPDACVDWFWALCLANDESAWQLELNTNGELELMPPTDEPSDVHENRTSSKVYLWDEQQGFRGVPTGPTAAYRLPNGALRLPDAAWTTMGNVRSRQAGDPRGRPYCPDFVVEIRSLSQRSLRPLLAKMQEYMDNGARLGWLIDPLERTVRIYRAGVTEPELLHAPETLDGEDVLTGFTFAVGELIFDLA